MSATEAIAKANAAGDLLAEMDALIVQSQQIANMHRVNALIDASVWRMPEEHRRYLDMDLSRFNSGQGPIYTPNALAFDKDGDLNEAGHAALDVYCRNYLQDSGGPDIVIESEIEFPTGKTWCSDALAEPYRTKAYITPTPNNLEAVRMHHDLGLPVPCVGEEWPFMAYEDRSYIAGETDYAPVDVVAMQIADVVLSLCSMLGPVVDRKFFMHLSQVLLGPKPSWEDRIRWAQEQTERERAADPFNHTGLVRALAF